MTVIAPLTLLCQAPENGLRPEPCRQGVAELPLRFIVCILCRRNPRDVAVRTNQKSIGGGGLLIASGRHHINSIAPTRRGVAEGRPIRQIKHNRSTAAHEQRNTELSRCGGGERNIGRPVAEQGVSVSAAGVHLVVNVDTRDHVDDRSMRLPSA